MLAQPNKTGCAEKTSEALISIQKFALGASCKFSEVRTRGPLKVKSANEALALHFVKKQSFKNSLQVLSFGKNNFMHVFKLKQHITEVVEFKWLQMRYPCLVSRVYQNYSLFVSVDDIKLGFSDFNS